MSKFPWVLAALVLAMAGTAPAGIAIEEKPVALISKNLVMRNGKPFVPLPDLAKALGGSGQFDQVKRRYAILPGSNGVLRTNPAAIAARGRIVPKGLNATSVAISFGGLDVMIDDFEVIMLRPAEPALSLNALASLLGGTAKLGAKGTWEIPPGGPGSPLAFQAGSSPASGIVMGGAQPKPPMPSPGAGGPAPGTSSGLLYNPGHQAVAHLANGTIKDPKTGLVWMKNANCWGKTSWNQAVTTIKFLKSGPCGLNDGSEAGNWRLPTKEELMAWQQNKQGFTNLPPGGEYWTSTPGDYPNSIWVVGMDHVFVGYDNKAKAYYSWPVRAGQ
jgi:hypothetical protein